MESINDDQAEQDTCQNEESPEEVNSKKESGYHERNEADGGDEESNRCRDSF